MDCGRSAAINFLALPPEVNSVRIYAGLGSGSMLAAKTAWDGLAAELSSAAASFGSVTSGLAGQWWQGPAAAAMLAAAAPYAAWLGAVAAQAEQAAGAARMAAEAFEATFAATVHPAAVATNRMLLLSLARSNLFGLNAPVIAAVEAEYEQMWAQDVAAMLGYHAAASTVGGQVLPWQQPPQNLTGPLPGSFTGTRITVPGAAPGLFTGSLSAEKYAALAAAIGGNWFPGTTAEVVNYPAAAGILSGFNKPTANQSFAIGQQILNTDIMNAVATGQPVVVAGLSEGTIVIDHEQAYLATAANAPATNMVTFVEFANPQRGLADTYLPAGFTAPGIGYTVGNAPVSQYHTDLVYTKYDGWADPPDRPWHLLADLNALAGAAHVHTPTALGSLSQAVEVSCETNALGGSTTTYMLPTDTLPLLMPLQNMGVPNSIVSTLNSVLTPIVNKGYSHYDPTAGAYFSHAHLVW